MHCAIVSNRFKEYNLLKMNSPQENFWKELFKLIILSLVIVIPFRLYIAQPFGPAFRSRGRLHGTLLRDGRLPHSR